MTALWSAYCAKCSTRDQLRAPDRETAHEAFALLGWARRPVDEKKHERLLCPACVKKHDAGEPATSEASRRG